MELRKKTAGGSGASGAERVKEKLHVGFEVRSGVEGAQHSDAANEILKSQGYLINDRTLALIVASKFDENVDDAVNTLTEALEHVGKFLAESTPEQIAAKAME